MCACLVTIGVPDHFFVFFLSQSIKGASLTIKDRNASCASYFTLTESVTSHTGVQCVPMVPYVS